MSAACLQRSIFFGARYFGEACLASRCNSRVSACLVLCAAVGVQLCDDGGSSWVKSPSRRKLLDLPLQIRNKLRLNVGFQSIGRGKRQNISSSCLALVAYRRQGVSQGRL